MRTSRSVVTPRLLGGLWWGTAGLAIIAYFGWHLWALFAPPLLSVYAPPRDIITKEMTVLFEGRTQRESAVTINGRSVAVASDGTFSDTVGLQDGMNIIEVRAVNKFGRESELTRRIIKE